MEDQSTPSQITNDPFAVIRIAEYRSLLLGRFTFIMALRMMSTMVIWWVYHLTKDPLSIGLVGLSEFIPAFFLALYSGHVIDISIKKKLLLKGLFFYFCAAALLLIISTSLISGRINNTYVAYIIYAVIFGTGIIRSFVGPVFSAIIATIVPRQLLQNATTWSQGTWLSASVIGHATGGFLIWMIGISGTLIVICLMLIVGLLIITRLKSRPAVQQSGEKKTWDSMIEGLRFVFRTKELLGAMALDMFAVLFGGAVAMVPVFAVDILKIGPIGYGWLNAASDIGAILVVATLTISPMKKNQGRKLLLAVAGFGICIIIFGISKWFFLSFIALLLAGMLDGVSVIVRGTVMQLKTPDHMRGRVSSVSSMFINSSNELGSFESGVASRLMGIVPSVVFGGFMTLLVVIVTWVKAPTLRKFEY